MTKRLFDLFFCIPGVILLGHFFLVIAWFIRLDSPGPAFFRQVRIGRNGKRFRLLKFRTMRVDAEKTGPPLTAGKDPRITRVGAILRKTKIDELPQLFNILSGDMSLVGPRPEVPDYVALYSSSHRRVLDLIPGITDLASIKYRNESELLAQSTDPVKTYVDEIMPEKIRINLSYASKATVWGDFLIILKTLGTLGHNNHKVV